MNIFVPIHAEALRVSPSTTQSSLDALYDFSVLGEHPVSSQGGLIAAKNFDTKITNLKTEPGIHLHWSIPKAYTRGIQDNQSGKLEFPTLPNRWLVTRFFVNKSTGKKETKMWVLESDAYGSVETVHQNATPVIIPVMSSSDGLYGLGNTKMGNLTPLDCDPANYPCWSEESTPNGITYLKNQLQAPFSYGVTFTAYYKNSRGAVGMYDSLDDLEVSLDQAKFSVSYSIIGWVSTKANDVANQVLAAYDAAKEPNFKNFLQQAIESELKWNLMDYTTITSQNYKDTQGILSGIVANINWNTNDGQTNYPSKLPDNKDITVAIGNNSAEAISAYLNGVNKGDSSQMPPDVKGNLEWLLNAFQYDQLTNLAGGTVGVGQIDEFLHNKSFASKAGGYIWSVKSPANLGGQKTPKNNTEITLNLTLAKFLSSLNNSQQQHDKCIEEIESRRKKLFMDWSYHVDALYHNVFKPKDYNAIQNDKTGVYLLDGINKIFPLYLKAGNFKPIEKPIDFTPASEYTPEVFNIQAPTTNIPNLANYSFNKNINKLAGGVMAQLITYQNNLESILPEGISNLNGELEIILLLMEAGQEGGSHAQNYIQQAIKGLESAQKTSMLLSNSFLQVSNATNGLQALKKQIDTSIANLTALLDPTNPDGFKKWFPIINGGLQNSPYKGKIADRTHSHYPGSWLAMTPFPGMKSILDKLTGQGRNTLELLDTQNAALYLAIAYLWSNSKEGNSIFSVAYNIEKAEQAITDAIKQGKLISTQIQTALSTFTGYTTTIGASLASYGSTHPSGALEDILVDLHTPSPNIADGIAKLKVLISANNSPTSPWPLPNMIPTFQSSNWLCMVENIEHAWNGMSNLLPYGQQTYLLANFLVNQLGTSYELNQVPAAAYWEPTEPVIVLGSGKVGNQLLKPISRNGRAKLLPCRLKEELVQYSAVNYPDKINNINKIIKLKSADTLGDIESLLKEAYLLTPEYSKSNVSFQELASAALKNKNTQESETTDVKLLPASGDPLNKLPYQEGNLPYFISFNFWQPYSTSSPSNPTYKDVFLPLMMYWEAEYIYADNYNLQNETYPGNYLTTNFGEDQYTVDYQPNPSALNNFKKNQANPNFINLNGVISLSSAVTANLQNGIRKFCLQNLNYDPSTGKPVTGSDNYQEKLEFYDAYNSFNLWDLLSQGLSGFNSSLLQEIQELQIPINIPEHWKNSVAKKEEQFWVTQYLHNQSANWGQDWSSIGLNFDAFTSTDNKAFFVPFRGGFLQIKKITLVDAFGRFVNVLNPNPTYVAESLQTSDNKYPVPSDNVYLAPRLTQPSRLKFDWVSAESPDGMSVFTELNPHPAASPICGWLMANHLDDSLLVYDSGGQPLGSVGRQNTSIHWYPVPGNEVVPLNNVSNPILQRFLAEYVKPGPSSDFSTFQNFLDILDLSQNFIITPGMKQDKSLAVLLGRPLVLVQAALKLEQKGMPDVSLDDNTNNPTYIPWNAGNAAFELGSNGFISYNFDNFNNGNIPQISIPILLGDPQVNKKNTAPIPFFDDGLVGFFVEGYDTFYTPLKLKGTHPKIKSTFGLSIGDLPISLKPNGDELRIILIMDPRASVRATSGILPVSAIKLPPDQYESAMERLMAYFLTAPILTYDYLADKKMEIPTPDEKGYSWSWYQIGGSDEPITAPQKNMDAVFPHDKTQHIIDGWLKLKEEKSK